jgi:hypothetical protein
MRRRDAVELIVLGSATPLTARAQHQHGTTPAAAAPAQRYFSPAQLELVDILSEMIVPADKHSGGAHDAKVADFIDEYVATAPPETQKAWTAGLAAVDREARKRGRIDFAACDASERDAILASMAEGEMSPKTDLHRFFVRLKAQTMSGYYTSSVGLLRDLQYKGIVPLVAYPPCEHPEHREAGN